jgi:hypothetical protein
MEWVLNTARSRQPERLGSGQGSPEKTQTGRQPGSTLLIVSRIEWRGA